MDWKQLAEGDLLVCCCWHGNELPSCINGGYPWTDRFVDCQLVRMNLSHGINSGIPVNSVNLEEQFRLPYRRPPGRILSWGGGGTWNVFSYHIFYGKHNTKRGEGKKRRELYVSRTASLLQGHFNKHTVGLVMAIRMPDTEYSADMLMLTTRSGSSPQCDRDWSLRCHFGGGKRLRSDARLS